MATKTATSDTTMMSTPEPPLVIPALAPFCAWVRDLSYPLMRLTVGGILLFTGFSK
jgi:hypothetical protein